MFIIFNDKGSITSETAINAGIVLLIAGILILVFTKKSYDDYKERGDPVY